MGAVVKPRTPVLAGGSRIPALVLFVVLAWFFATFIYFPNLSIILAVFDTEDGLGSLYKRLTSSSRVVNGIIETGIVAVISLITVNIVGISQVFLLEGVKIRGKKLLTVAFALPLVFGSVSAVSGYALVYGRTGLLTGALQSIIPSLPEDWFIGRWGVIFIHTFSMTGFHFLFLRPAVRQVDFSLVEAARSLGMNPVRALVSVVLPAIRPMLLTTTLMVLIMATSSFAAPHILGGPGFTMVGPLVLTLNNIGRPDMAAMLALMLGFVTGGLMFVALRSERRFAAMAASKVPVPFEPVEISSRAGAIGAHTLAYVLAFINLLPFAATILLSVSPLEDIRSNRISLTPTLAHYRGILTDSDLFEPLRNSLGLSIMAVSAAVLIGSIAAVILHRRGDFVGDAVQISVFLPYFLPGILIAIGFLLAFGGPTALLGNRVLVGSYGILPLAYIVMLLPLVVRLVGAGLAGIDGSLDEAAQSLGAGSARRALLVSLPLLAPVLVQTAAISFNGTFDEYTLSVMLHNINNRPLGVVLGTLAGSNDPSEVGTVTGYIVTNTLVALSVILVADRMAARAARRSVGR